MKISKTAVLAMGCVFATAGLGLMVATVVAGDESDKKDLLVDLSNAIQHIEKVTFISSGTDTSRATAQQVGGSDRLVGIKTNRFVLSESEKSNIIKNGKGLSILGGKGNTINSGAYNIILAGSGNKTEQGTYNTILGGEGNRIGAKSNSTIIGGSGNQVGGSNAVIVGGYNNEAKGDKSVVVGNDSHITGTNSTALGLNSKINAKSSFLWTDGKESDTLQASGVFAVVSQSGMVINTDKAHPLAQLTIGKPMIVYPSDKSKDIVCKDGKGGGIMKVMKNGESNQVCFCSCDGSGWNSLFEGRGSCLSVCKGNDYNPPKCGTEVKKLCIEGASNNTQFSGTCEVGEVLEGTGAYLVTSDNRVHWSCQTEDGSVNSSCSGTVNSACQEWWPTYICEAGTYLPKNSRECKPCKCGHYCPGIDSGVTVSNVDQGIYECENGLHSNTGAVSCESCPEGQQPTTNKCGCTDKIVCEAGTYLPANSIECDQCPCGSYCPGVPNGTPRSSQDQGITSCGDGKYGEAGSSSQSSCKACNGMVSSDKCNCEEIPPQDPECGTNAKTRYFQNKNTSTIRWYDNENDCKFGEESSPSFVDETTKKDLKWTCREGIKHETCYAHQQWCGDGEINGDEECDLGNNNGSNSSCTTNCKSAAGCGPAAGTTQYFTEKQRSSWLSNDELCGDNFQRGYRITVTGTDNHLEWNCVRKTGTYFEKTCKAYQQRCGDGKIQTEEDCDDGVNNGKVGFCPSTCKRFNCKAPSNALGNTQSLEAYVNNKGLKLINRGELTSDTTLVVCGSEAAARDQNCAYVCSNSNQVPYSNGSQIGYNSCVTATFSTACKDTQPACTQAQCGSINGGTFSTFPTSNRCGDYNTFLANTFNTYSTGWTWKCKCSNTNTTIDCWAKKDNSGCEPTTCDPSYDKTSCPTGEQCDSCTKTDADCNETTMYKVKSIEQPPVSSCSSTLKVDPNGGQITFNGTTTTSATTATRQCGSGIYVPDPSRTNTTTGDCKVDFDGDGGNVSASSRTTTITKTTVYNFKAWSDSGKCGGWNPSTNMYTFYMEDGKTCTKTAQWEEGTPTTSTGEIILPTATRPGYDFLGWYTAKGPNGDLVGVAQGKYEPRACITLYAHWKEIPPTPCENTLKVNPNGGKVSLDGTPINGGSFGSTTKQCGSTSNIDTSSYIVTGTENCYVIFHKNDGTEASERMNAIITTKTEYYFNNWTNSSNCGKWEAPHYTHPATSGTICTKTANWGTSKTTSKRKLNLSTPTNSSYVFEGWYDAASGGNLVIPAGATEYEPTQTQCNINLYAHWRETDKGICYEEKVRGCMNNSNGVINTGTYMTDGKITGIHWQCQGTDGTSDVCKINCKAGETLSRDDTTHNYTCSKECQIDDLGDLPPLPARDSTKYLWNDMVSTDMNEDEYRWNYASPYQWSRYGYQSSCMWTCADGYHINDENNPTECILDSSQLCGDIIRNDYVRYLDVRYYDSYAWDTSNACVGGGHSYSWSYPFYNGGSNIINGCIGPKITWKCTDGTNTVDCWHNMKAVNANIRFILGGTTSHKYGHPIVGKIITTVDTLCNNMACFSMRHAQLRITDFRGYTCDTNVNLYPNPDSPLGGTYELVSSADYEKYCKNTSSRYDSSINCLRCLESHDEYGNDVDWFGKGVSIKKVEIISDDLLPHSQSLIGGYDTVFLTNYINNLSNGDCFASNRIIWGS